MSLHSWTSRDPPGPPRYLAPRNAVVAERMGQAAPSFLDRGWYVDGVVTAVQRFEDRAMAGLGAEEQGYPLGIKHSELENKHSELENHQF